MDVAYTVDKPKVPEAVNHPAHYGGDTPYEVIKVLEAWLTPGEFVGFLKGNIIKYHARSRLKGNPIQDAAKAQWYDNYLNDYLKRTKDALANT